jgi:P-type E1-E2 ATPase
MRAETERNLTFLGLAMFENPIKKESTGVIQELLRVHLRPIMVTGDHLMTAVEIAQQLRIIDKRDKVALVRLAENVNEPTIEVERF